MIYTPLHDKTTLRKIFFEQLSIVLDGTPEDLVDKPYLYNLFWDGIDFFLRTLRDVKRLINAIRVDYPAVRGEVNPADFIAIETLRVFLHEIYCLIRANPEMFCGHSDSGSNKQDEELKVFHEGLIQKFPSEVREPVKNLLKRLFPKLEGIRGIFGNTNYGADWEREWRKKRRICSKDVFDLYFRFMLPEGYLSNEEIKSYLAIINNAEAFGSKLVELSRRHRPDGMTLVSSFLERLLDFVDEIPKSAVPAILEALFNVGDLLLVPEDEPRGFFDWGNDIRIGRLFFSLLKKYETPQERFEILKEVFSKGRAISTIVSEVAVLGQQHGKYGSHEKPDSNPFISLNQLEVLEKIALQKIKDAAEQGVLLSIPKLPAVLYRWRDWDEQDSPKKWIQQSKILDTDETMVDLLTAFLTKTFSVGASDRVSRTKWRLSPKSLEPFLEPGAIIHRCKQLQLSPPAWLTGEKLIAVNTFVKEFELIRQGKDPADEIEL
jgi:predicted KAP-like P-loop ATPase